MKAESVCEEPQLQGDDGVVSENDNHLDDNTMNEASNFRMPKELRALFTIICTHSEPVNPFELWCRYKTHMIEDYARAI